MTSHDRIVTVAIAIGAAAVITFRVLIELGFGPRGSLFIRVVPLEYAFLAWFLASAALLFERRRVSGEPLSRITTYQWWLGIAGLAGTVWLAQQIAGSRRVLSAGWIYWLAAACVAAVFVSASAVKRSGTLAVLSKLPEDASRILARPATWICALASLAVLAAGPRSQEMPSGGKPFDRWYLRQPRASVPASWQPSGVTLVELRDYQSPASREAARRYEELIHQSTLKYGGLFGFQVVDYPLEPECHYPAGAGRGRHPAACEAAAAVRLARRAGPEMERRVIDWLWAHQGELTPDFVFEGVNKEFGLDLRGRYSDLLADVRVDTREGKRLGVSGVPAFFLNGRRLPLLAPRNLEAAIRAEINLMTRENRTITP